MTGHHCESTIGNGAGPTTPSGGGGCPPVPPGLTCEFGVIDDFDSNGCLVSRRCRESATAPGGPGGGPLPSTGRQCPVDNTCPDGSRPCQLIDNRCECKPCPPPQGCTEERDPQTGFVRVICEQRPEERCPDTPYGADKPCREKGGNPVWRTDSRGCNFIDCVLNEVGDNPFDVNRACPHEEEIQRVREKCTDGKFVIMDDRGCKVGICRGEYQQQLRQECGLVSAPERENIEADCKAKGLGTVSNFDERGCQTITCGNPNECVTKLPDKAYSKCKEEGGEMVVKSDKMGCITFKQCVRKGDDSEIYYEDVEEMPEVTELLSIAFKLEDLKIQFDKLRQKTEEVARYYESTGSGEAERFKRVAGMFNSIKDKIDEIKSKMRDRIETITKEDVMEFKHDIKYIKDKMLKDILYLMLSSSEEVRSITSRSASDCGNDGRCFDEALRVCKQVTFNPEDDKGGGPVVKITGIEGSNCVITATVERGPGGRPMSMTCSYPNYAMGMRGPEDLIPYCQGEMADFLKKYGTEGPAGPGGCKNEQECDAYCRTNPQECMKWCEDNPGMCPGFDEGGAATGRTEPASTQPCPQPPAPIECGTNERVVDDSDYRGCIVGHHCEPAIGGGATGGVTPCSGCLNNGICDSGECAGCPDCIGGGA